MNGLKIVNNKSHRNINVNKETGCWQVLSHHRFWVEPPVLTGSADWGKSLWTWCTAPAPRPLSSVRPSLDDILALQVKEYTEVNSLYIGWLLKGWVNEIKSDTKSDTISNLTAFIWSKLTCIEFSYNCLVSYISIWLPIIACFVWDTQFPIIWHRKETNLHIWEAFLTIN